MLKSTTSVELPPAAPAIVSDSLMARKWRTLVFALVIIALVLRVTAAVVIDRHVHSAGRQFLIEGDANGYWELGQRLAAGEEYSLYSPPRRVLRVPGFPLLLAASISLFGDSVFAARIVLATVGAVCCWLTYVLGRLLHTRRAGFWAALFVTVNPLHIGNSVLILSETWFTLWMLLSLIVLLRLLDPHDLVQVTDSSAWLRSLMRRAAVTGVMIGCTTLIRPGFLPWLGIAAVALWLLPQTTEHVNRLRGNEPRGDELQANRLDRRDRPVLLAGIMITACVLTMLPWALRNKSATGHLVFTSLWSGPSLYDGLNPNADGRSNMQFFEDEHVLAHMTEYEMNQHYRDRALEFARQNPRRAIGLAVTKAALYLGPRPNFAKERGWVVSAVCVLCWVTLFGLCIAGLVSREWEMRGLLIVAGPIVLFLLVHMVFVGSVRYRLPVEFPLSVLSAIGWCWLLVSRQSSVVADQEGDMDVVAPSSPGDDL